MTKREALKRVRDIIRRLENQQMLPTNTCSVAAEKKLEMFMKKAPASLVYELSYLHSQLLHSRNDVSTILNRLKQPLHNEGVIYCGSES